MRHFGLELLQKAACSLNFSADARLPVEIQKFEILNQSAYRLPSETSWAS
jgi:hypothetical protein